MAERLADELGEHRHAVARRECRCRLAEHEGGRGVAAVAFVGPAGQPGAHVGQHGHRGTGDSAAVISAPTPERTEPTMSTAERAAGSRSAAWIAVAFVLSR